MPSTNPCPKCGEYSFHKSRTKNFYEKTRKKITRQQPYRCHDCGYRGWISSKILHSTFTNKQIIVYAIVFVVAVIFSLVLKSFLF